MSKRSLAGIVACVVLLLAAVCAEQDAYYSVPLSGVQILNGALPARDANEIRMWTYIDRSQSMAPYAFLANGEAYVALIDAARLDYYHTLEREHVLLSLLDEADRGLADVEAGRVLSVAELRARYGR